MSVEQINGKSELKYIICGLQICVAFKMFFHIAYVNILSPRQMCFLVIVIFLFQRTLQVLLPDLAAKASPAASALIRTLGKQLNVNRREILINNFKYIF